MPCITFLPSVYLLYLTQSFLQKYEKKNSRNMRKNKRHFIVFFIYIGFLFQFKCEGKEVLELKEGQLLQRKRQYAKRLVNINLCQFIFILAKDQSNNEVPKPNYSRYFRKKLSRRNVHHIRTFEINIQEAITF